METLSDFFYTLTDPEKIITIGGLALITFIVFAETGLFFGFFLPGDSLLFTAGLLCGTGVFDTSVQTLLFSVTMAGIAGNYVGYYFGKKTGPVLFKRDDSLLFKKKYVFMASDFYNRYGGMALVLGRFMPIIRTFAPILAGVVGVDLKKFTFYNITGSILWVFSMILAGYFLGREFPQIKEYLEYIIVGIIILSIIPVIRTLLKERRRQREMEKIQQIKKEEAAS